MKEELKKLSNEELENISGGGGLDSLLPVCDFLVQSGAPLFYKGINNSEVIATVLRSTTLKNVMILGDTAFVPLNDNLEKLKIEDSQLFRNTTTGSMPTSYIIRQ